MNKRKTIAKLTKAKTLIFKAEVLMDEVANNEIGLPIKVKEGLHSIMLGKTAKVMWDLETFKDLVKHH